MTAHTPHAFFLSSAGHALVAALLLLRFNLSPSPPIAPTLTLVNTAPWSASAPGSASFASTTPVTFQSPVVKPPPTPAPSFVAPGTAPLPTTTPAVHPPTPPKKLSATPPRTGPSSTAPRPSVAPAAPIPQIDVADLTAGLTPASPERGPRPANPHLSPAALEAYFALLKSRALTAFVKPPDLPEGLVTEISVTISAAGALSPARIARSSGHRAFDDAVLAAFARVRLPEKPDRRPETLTLSFRTADVAGQR